MDNFNSRRPHYNDSSDFSTNAGSYYDDLARKNKLMKLLASRIWEYDKILFASLEEVQDVLEQVIHKIGEGFNEEIYDLLILWVADGTLDHIINVTLMNLKADKLWVDEEILGINNRVDGEILGINNRVDQAIIDITDDVVSLNDFVDAFILDINARLQADIDNLNNYKTSNNNAISLIHTDIDTLQQATPENHYYSEYFATLQDAVFAAEGGTLFVKPGTYQIETPIKIRSNTKIIAYGATFKRNASINVMFINDSNGNKTKYSASENIEINGGIFDGAGSSIDDICTIVAFGHARDITVKNATFRNLQDWHMVEFNAVLNGLIENCYFYDYGTETTGSEMVQIDIFKGVEQFPWFGPYDDTTCQNINIINNTFRDGVKAIGTHSQTEGKEHLYITIEGNKIFDMRDTAIYGVDWGFTKIQDNHLYNVFMGVVLDARRKENNNHDICNNYMYGAHTTGSRGIQIMGKNGGYDLLRGNISNNKVVAFNHHGIGVDYTKDWIIEGNHVRGCGGAGIICYNSENVNIANNLAKGNAANLSENMFDITVSLESKNVIVNNNNIDTIYVTSNTTNSLITGNIIKTSKTISGATNFVSNNVIAGVLVP